MRYVVIVLSSVLVAVGLSCARRVELPRQERSAFASRIVAILPPGWIVEERNGEVIIHRQDTVLRFTCVSLDLSLMRDKDRFEQFVERNGVTDSYRIRLHRATKLETSEYTRLRALNDQIAVTKFTHNSPREFYEDDAMRSFDSRYNELPQYYDDSSSIYVQTTIHPYECVYPRKVAEECDSVRQSLDSLFTRYSNSDDQKKVTYGLW